MRSFSIVVWLAALGCTHGPTPVQIVGNTHASDEAPKTETLGAQLQRTIGGGAGGASVAILPADDGLVAESSSGAHRTVIVPKVAVDWALVDPHTNVVWFAVATDHATVYALDLDAPAADGAKPHAVVKGLPENFGEFAAGYPSDHPDPEIPVGADDDNVSFTMDLRLSRVILRIAAQPKLTGQAGVYETSGSGEDEFAKTIAREAKIADVAFVQMLAKRKDRSAAFVEQKEVAITEGIDKTQCGDDSCGKGVMVPDTKYGNIVVSQACGDGCDRGQRLFDLTTNKPLDGEWATWLARGAMLSPDRKAFVADGVVVRFEGGPVGEPPPLDKRRRGGGWIGGGSGDRFL